MRSAPLTRIAIGVALAASSLPACRADESVLDAIYKCDPEAGDAQCGTDEEGKPMTCYVGSAQLGGKAFCTKTCDPDGEAARGFHCTSSGALLETCNPGADENSCQSPLNCYRTDVIFQGQGLCMWVPVCPLGSDGITLDDDQCPIAHSVCAGNLLRELVSGTAFATSVLTDNLHCVAECSQDEPCQPTVPSERCPTDFYSSANYFPVVCGAVCDQYSCPPNYSCAKSSSPEAPPVCLPGVLGMRCTSDESCIAGACEDTGGGFSVCTVGVCTTDEDCLMYGSSPALVCADDLPGGVARCISTIPFAGAPCQESSDCSAELLCGGEPCPPRDCSPYSLSQLDPMNGDCRFTCDPAEGCPSFGGVPHVCLEGVIGDELGGDFGGCHPGNSATPCTSSEDCIANLVCASVPPDDRSRTQHPTICTVPCGDAERPEDSGDADCDANPWFGAGYCVPVSDPVPGTLGYCRTGGQRGRLCERDTHCLTRDCPKNEDGSPSRCN